ncbi:MAG TPA: hypothetical protein VK283_02595, partial [Acidimicrobiales bacterium]|nr:hypothetical protein [Acidimicrobiales bacterium]
GVRLEAVEESVERFVHEAMLGLADLEPEDLGHGNLTVPLGLSLWMRRGRVRVETARDAMLELRAAVLRASELDERTEPVPLLLADPVAATISLALYMDGLLQRAARANATSRAEMARRALELVSD